MMTSARGVRHPQGVVIMALPWCGGRTRAPCSPALAEGGPVPLPGGEGRGAPGREQGWREQRRAALRRGLSPLGAIGTVPIVVALHDDAHRLALDSRDHHGDGEHRLWLGSVCCQDGGFHALCIGGISVADGHDGTVAAHGTDVEGWDQAVFEAGVEAVRTLLRVHVVFSLRRDLMVGQRRIPRMSRALQ